MSYEINQAIANIEEELQYYQANFNRARAQLENMKEEMTLAKVTQAVYQAKKELKLPMSIEFDVTKCDRGIAISFLIPHSTYDEIIQMDNAHLSWNGNWIEARTEVNFDWGYVHTNVEAKVPESDKEVLKYIGLIQDKTEVQQRAMC